MDYSKQQPSPLRLKARMVMPRLQNQALRIFDHPDHKAVQNDKFDTLFAGKLFTSLKPVVSHHQVLNLPDLSMETVRVCHT